VKNLKKLIPVNRHLVVVPHNKSKETKSGVLLPEDYTAEEGRYITATVVDVAKDCSENFRKLKYDNPHESVICVEKSMIQEIDTESSRHFIVLENYVVGIVSNVDEM
tara:strand:+ start:1570 stop:1890 length:321 start_codon:yes stop_codon:yes gene_type:complete